MSRRNALPVAERPAVRRHARDMFLRRRGEVAKVVALHATAAVAGLVAPWLVGTLIDDVARGTTIAAVDTVALWLAIFVVVQTVLTRWARYASDVMGERMLAELREDFVDDTLALPLATVERGRHR